MSEKKFLGFFSGALGLDSGLERAGLISVAANEFDPVACKTIRRNRPDLKLYDEDIREITVDRLKQDLKIESEELFAIVGGPPCQAFSTAGKRLGLNDDRGNVFLHFIDLIDNQVGLTGRDGRLIRARKLKMLDHKDPSIEHGVDQVGEIESIDPAVVKALLDDQFIAVISPLCFGARGGRSH